MSKEKQSGLEMLLGKIDLYLIWEGGHPMIVIPQSERAKSLFIRWGMPEKADGITPPADAFDLMTSIPNDWVMGMKEATKDTYTMVDIPLPQPMLVLH